MALTRNFKETILARAQRDPRFRQALFTEAINAYLVGDTRRRRPERPACPHRCGMMQYGLAGTERLPKPEPLPLPKPSASAVRLRLHL